MSWTQYVPDCKTVPDTSTGWLKVSLVALSGFIPRVSLRVARYTECGERNQAEYGDLQFSRFHFLSPYLCYLCFEFGNLMGFLNQPHALD
jgi:hypothetical protein